MIDLFGDGFFARDSDDTLSLNEGAVSRAGNYYDILEINTNANEKEIEVAIKKARAKYHPDKYHPDKKERATKICYHISKISGVLQDESLKEIYDKEHDKLKPPTERVFRGSPEKSKHEYIDPQDQKAMIL